jgi:hypothetical protein
VVESLLASDADRDAVANEAANRRSRLLTWSTLIEQPWKIMIIARRDWTAVVAQSEDWC